MVDEPVLIRWQLFTATKDVIKLTLCYKGNFLTMRQLKLFLKYEYKKVRAHQHENCRLQEIDCGARP